MGRVQEDPWKPKDEHAWGQAQHVVLQIGHPLPGCLINHGAEWSMADLVKGHQKLFTIYDI